MEYKDMLNMVEGIESGSVKSAASFVDISKVEANPPNNVTYNELLSKIMSIASSRAREERQPKEAQKPAHIVTAGLAQAAYSQPHVPVQQVPGAAQPPVQPPVQPSVQPPVQPAVQPAIEVQLHAPKAAEEEAKRAKIELKSIVKKLGSVAKAPSLRTRRVNVDELVLPNLTLTDQISELERIIEGLRENVFDKEHKAIVQEELYGLNQVANAAKKQKKQMPKSELERSLFELRDQHLSEALALLSRVA